MDARVLLVANDDVAGRAMEQALDGGGLGLHVVRVDTGDAALACVTHGGFGAVVVDHRLRGGEGRALLAALRSGASRIPLIVVVGPESEAVGAEISCDGATGYVVERDGYLPRMQVEMVGILDGARGYDAWAHEQAVLATALAAAPLSPPARSAVALAVDDAATAVRGRRWGDVVDRLDAALEMVAGEVPGAQALRAELTTALAHARWRAGDAASAHRLALDAVQSARRAGAPFVLARAVLGFAGSLQGFGVTSANETLVALLTEVLDILPEGPTAERALAMARLAEELTFSPRAAERVPLASAALAMARRLGRPDVLAGVLRSTHWALWTPESMRERRALAYELAALGECLRDPGRVVEGQMFRLLVALEGGELEVARLALTAARDAASAQPQPYYCWLVATAAACLAAAGGELAAVRGGADEALCQGQQAHNPNAVLFFGVQVGALQWMLGQHDELVHALHDLAAAFPTLAPAAHSALAVTYAEAGRLDDARRVYEVVLEDGRWNADRNPTWLAALSFLAETCTLLGDRGRAAQFYVAMLPFASSLVTLPPAAVYAPVRHYLGLLAATLGRHEDAAEHFDAALAFEASCGLLQWRARTQVAYAGMLLDRGVANPPTGVRALLTAAAATAAQLGLSALAARVQRIQQALPAVSLHEPGLESLVVGFMRPGSCWEIEFDRQRCVVKDAAGLHRLVQLLRQPGIEIDAVELCGGSAQVSPGVPSGCDARAARSLRQEERRLAQEARAAAECGDIDAAEAARHEAARIAARLSGDRGRRGKPWQAGAGSECARLAARKSIRRVVDTFRRALPDLAAHLDRSLSYGRCLVYRPDAKRPVRWIIHDAVA
ncbi:MAG: hypothetical protein KIT14_05470 [bacterium]|nr:hypothetical protein [bacterium]